MVQRFAVLKYLTASGCARVVFDTIFRLDEVPREIVSGRDPRFTNEFCSSMFKTLEARLKMSTSDHPESGFQTERANRVSAILRGHVHSCTNRSEFLSMVDL